ncbi:uncharacterized protein BJ171DRAFT_511749 [Polychytrium aggregatum]|uniref:uncharacterized protein n=1 Tax=Polychytrium aggregatum TaxID=110093 RepID=UPI0022FF2DDE|nr:uncharacterized protein BJ171DRAFT_511749 [Polychytrium aggregatum]KAI9203082.1 hypothetical protein BJ171DRAFT_511749 [Polychytrium aggregatum]
MPSLNASERSLVNSTFGRNAVLASAVVRRYKAHPIPTRWTYTGQRGALVLTAGSLKLLDLDTGDIVWETLIDSSSDYCDDANFFHSFASAEDRCMVGFCFALESEAADFFRAVQDDSSRQSPVAPSQLAAPKPSYAPVPAPRLPLAPKATTPSPAANVIDLKPIERSVSAPPVESKEEETKSRGLLFGMGKSKSSKGSDKKDKSSGKSKKKGAITKDMISGPTNFEHISHVGYNTKTGSFNAENIPEEWKIIFAKAGISEESLKSDRSMQKFAKKFMRDNADLVGKVQKSGPPPPPPVKYNGGKCSLGLEETAPPHAWMPSTNATS